ncbi:MAG: hypothetical protein KDL87_09985, partial [Verrucomicrobiae bacterium]|nr:hypothetical protein [Verrucomicrobiae bacterium]
MSPRAPTNLMKKEAVRLFPGDSTEGLAFLEALLTPPRYPACLLWTQGERPSPFPFEAPPYDAALPWLPSFVT